MADFLGIPLTGKPSGNVRFFAGASHVYCYYDASGNLKIICEPPGADNSWTPVPASLQSTDPGLPYHEPYAAGAVIAEPDGTWYKWVAGSGFAEQTGALSPMAAYNSDGTVKTAGWLPNGTWAALDGTITPTQPGTSQAATPDAVNALLAAAVAFANTVTG